jgi:hypothetical protein
LDEREKNVFFYMKRVKEMVYVVNGMTVVWDFVRKFDFGF